VRDEWVNQSEDQTFLSFEYVIQIAVKIEAMMNFVSDRSIVCEFGLIIKLMVLASSALTQSLRFHSRLLFQRLSKENIQYSQRT
jgi:hypothetical protein